jgi:hypothetical protein
MQIVEIDEQALAQILPNRRFPLGLRQPAHGHQIILLDAGKIVLGLRLGHAEHRIRIALPMDVRDAEAVANDANACGAISWRIPRCLDGRRQQRGRGDKQDR